MKNLIVIFLLIFSFSTSCAEVEGFFGAAYTSFSDLEGYDTAGASARIKYNRYNSNKGFFLFSNFKGESIINFDALLGYGVKTNGSWFFEAGGGLWYSFYFGSGYGGILATGIELGGNWFLNLPMIIRFGGLEFIQIAPMIGMRF
jgi:hypothetical protein